MPIPARLTAGEPADALAAYVSLAERAGVVDTRAVKRARLHQFLVEREIFVYPYPAVIAFLDAEARERHKLWDWAPLLLRDAERTRRRRYERAVPAHALEKVAIIEEKFPGTLAFYVNDYDVADPDPFLIVGIPGSNWEEDSNFVIDHWDEPKFDILSLFERADTVSERR